jgi:rfaE bifunctional protein kinase chain/domain
MDRARLTEHLQNFRSKHILIIGDVMLDRFIWGNVSRISPEAPVPVVEVTRDDYYPGGAANVARNLIHFADRVSVMGRAGVDADGDQLVALLDAQLLDSSGILRDEALPTTVKTRVIARHQQVVRIDQEKFALLSGEMLDQAMTHIESRLDGIDAIILQDYGKGFVTQDLVDRLAELNKDMKIPITVDPNPSNPINWKGAMAIKPNRHEAFKVADLAEVPIGKNPAEDATVRKLADILFAKWDTNLLLITLGEQGMAVCEREGAIHHIPSRAQEVFDVSGAGDTAIALFTLALASGLTPHDAAEVSNYASAVVVGKVGTATLSAEELLASLP